MRNTGLFVIAALAGAGLLAAGPVSATAAPASAVAGAAGSGRAMTATSSAATACGVTWGSLPRSGAGEGTRPLTDVRTGRHDCFDRMVLDVRGATPANPPAYTVRYVDSFRQDGSGRLVEIGGGAILEIVATAPSYDPETHTPTYAGRGGKPLPGVNLAGYRTFRDARFGASYEGTTQLGLGVRARLPFRVQQLGDRLVIDVAHTWAAAR